MSQHEISAEDRIDALIRASEQIGRRLDAVEERHAMLARSKIPQPRFPYWNWLLQMEISEDTKIDLTILLSELSDRVNGKTRPEAFEWLEQIEGVSYEILRGSGRPPPVADIMTALKAVAGLQTNADVMELIMALRGQRMFLHVWDYVLNSTELSQR